MSAANASGGGRNRLAGETSPYLLQHKDNPVDWWPWGAEALAEAARRNVPILLSIGYSACHWCHVMAEESFSDEGIAALMNAHFVNVKVDREERPEIDQIYQTALAALGQPGGWPLTMFLSPDGSPFWGGTYFPPAARYDRPGFPDVLRRVAEVYAGEPATVAQNGEAIVERLRGLSAEGRPGRILPGLLDEAARHLAQAMDPVHGGLGSAPKFPQFPVLELVWRAHVRTGEAPLGDAVRRALAHMAQGGIYDHLGGGIARYSTDAEWLVPHFEKMLSDNAQLIDLATQVWQRDRDPLLAERVRETVGWALREMTVEGGTFATSLDADSGGGEGRFYLWTEGEIDRALGARAAGFKAAYGVRPGGNWEGYTILNRLARLAWGPAEAEAELGAARARLLAVREARPRPARDDKVLADWNGMMIAALAQAGLAFGEQAWIDAAARAFAAVAERLVVDNRLRHSWCGGRPGPLALLEDHAQMARAALALHEATGSAHHLAQAEDWIAALDRHHWDAEQGGYFQAPDDGEALIARTRSAADAATPSGNATAAAVLGRLHLLTGTDAYRSRAEKIVEAFAGELARTLVPYAALLNAHDLLAGAIQVVIVGRDADPATAALRDAAARAPAPNRILLTVPPDQDLPTLHPAYGKTSGAARPAAFVCVGRTCSLPIADPAALADALARASSRPPSQGRTPS